MIASFVQLLQTLKFEMTLSLEIFQMATWADTLMLGSAT